MTVFIKYLKMNKTMMPMKKVGSVNEPMTGKAIFELEN